MRNKLVDYLGHIQQAAADALAFTEGVSKSDFLADKRTQQAAIFSLIIIGEATAKIMDEYPAFVALNNQIPWRSIRNMRNRMAHGYFEINLDIVWDTLKNWLPELQQQLSTVLADLDTYGSQNPNA